MSIAHHFAEPTAIHTNLGAIFVSMELSRSTWLVTSLSPGGGEKMSKHSVSAGDIAALLTRFSELKQKALARTGKSFPIIVIQEAGLDGFWIHRVLQSEGVESHVVDPASIATSRRRRRAKTDKIDGEALVRALLAYKRGEPRVCAMVRAPTPEDEDSRPHGNAMFVFNHSSYVDAMLLAAILPGEPAYVAKSELARQFFAGPFLRRLRALFVDRYDVGGVAAEIEAILDAARTGRNLVFFPEGTFTRRAGLSDFYLGAFKIAAAAGLPVFPGILRGTRSMLRGDQWFPRWTPLSVRIECAVKPSGTDFTSLVELRDAVRKVVLTYCGEPDLGELVKPETTPNAA